MRNPYNHIDMRVRDMVSARPFYEALLKALGFTGPEEVHEPDGRVWQNFRFRHGPIPSQFVGLIELQDHQANENCLAFHVPTRQRVDEVAAIAAAAGGQVEAPEICPEYGDTYYVAFLRDPSGNRLEVCCFVEAGETSDRSDVMAAVACVQLPESYRIRAWRRADYESVAELGKSSHLASLGDEPDQLLRAWAGSWPALVVAHEAEGLVGYLRAISDYEYHSEVIDLVVTPRNSRAELQRALLSVCQALVPRTQLSIRAKSETVETLRSLGLTESVNFSGRFDPASQD